MGDFRLEDLWAIIQGLIIVGLLLFGGMAAIALWPKIRALTAAAWRRYVLFSWEEFLAWLADLDQEAVNSFEQDTPEIMSRTEENASLTGLSDLRQTALQTDSASDRQFQTRFSRSEILDICRLLREYSVPRERARQALKSIGMPIDNNLWVEAAPAPSPEPEYTTPIANRPTRAQFETDPELAYQQPPQ